MLLISEQSIEEVKLLEVQCQQQQYQIHELGAKNQAFNETIADQNEELQRLDQDTRHPEQEVKNFDRQLVRLKDEAQSSENRIQHLAAENEGLTQKVEPCIQEIKHLKDELSKYKAGYRRFEERNRSFQQGTGKLNK